MFAHLPFSVEEGTDSRHLGSPFEVPPGIVRVNQVCARATAAPRLHVVHAPPAADTGLYAVQRDDVALCESDINRFGRAVARLVCALLKKQHPSHPVRASSPAFYSYE